MEQAFQQITSERKKDHIELAFRSRVAKHELDDRFYYEPILSGHPHPEALIPQTFLDKTFKVPLWVSSMTGGTAMAGAINKNLARACAKFGFGMGLGSCRIILEDDTYLPDFQLRPLLGEEVAFYANLGVAQVEELVANNKIQLIQQLVEKIDADGLIVHINPLQEWLQPEGDRYYQSPLLTIQKLLDKWPGKVIVKEVGQGMGPRSLSALMQLPIEAIEFAANGGTNFALLELLRADASKQSAYEGVPRWGHSAEEMVRFANQLSSELGEKALCKQVIISGGVRSFLDGYYLRSLCQVPSVYGQASEMLKRAQHSYEELDQFLENELKGLTLAQAFLTIRK